jgi:hypothetical protein
MQRLEDLSPPDLSMPTQQFYLKDIVVGRPVLHGESTKTYIYPPSRYLSKAPFFR